MLFSCALSGLVLTLGACGDSKTSPTSSCNETKLNSLLDSTLDLSMQASQLQTDIMIMQTSIDSASLSDSLNKVCKSSAAYKKEAEDFMVEASAIDCSKQDASAQMKFDESVAKIKPQITAVDDLIAECKKAGL